MSHEEGESSKGVDQGKEDKRSKSRETKDDGSDQHKHRHHKREKSKQDIRKSKDDSEEKKDHHRREKSREKHHKHEKSKHDGEDEQEKKSSRNSSRKEGLERKESSRRTIKHARHASEMPADNNAVLMEFARNMELMHRNSEPNLRSFVHEAKLTKIAEDKEREKKKQPKKVHPAIALIKSAISSRLAAISKDREEKHARRETASRLRRNTITEAASIFQYELRDSSSATPPASGTSPTYTHAPLTHASSANVTSTLPNQEPDFLREPDQEREQDYEPDMVFEKSYTPDLMRYADVDLPPHLSPHPAMVH